MVGEDLRGGAAASGQGEQEVFVADGPFAATHGDAQRVREQVPGPTVEGSPPEEATAGTDPALGRQRALPVRLFDPRDDLRDIDAHPREGVRVGAGETAPAADLAEIPYDPFAPARRQAERGQRERAAAALTVEQGEQHMRLLDPLRPRPLGMRHRRLHHGPGVLREPLEHHCLPYFLCTACLLTPSSAAISCHDQP